MYKNLKKLLIKLEEYEKYHNDFNESEFALWLLSTSNKEVIVDNKPREFKVDSYIAMLIGFMQRYSNFYTKIVFKNSKIYSIDDYGFLITLLWHGKLTKTKLINLNLLEKPSGIEIIKRLFKRGLIIQQKSSGDKREKFIFLTQDGEDIISKYQKIIIKLSSHIVGDLNNEEKINILNMLTKLHEYHKPYFLNKKKDSIIKKLKL